MIFGYNSAAGALRKKGLLVAMGVVAIPLGVHLHSSFEVSSNKAKIPVSSDPRVDRLHRFLTKLSCPVADMAEDFVRVADENHLDWRLLPSIAVIESGGGKAYKYNNIFGWNGGTQAFDSIESGMELVAYKLGNSPQYRRHDSLGKLRIYNENEDYPAAVLAVMNRISPDVQIHNASRPVLRDKVVNEASLVQF